MSNLQTILETARRTFEVQSAAIRTLADQVGDSFGQAVEKIISNKGRLVVSGIGKSAIVAQKIVATLNSTGTPSLYMHAADAIHGDLGMVAPDDVVLVISKSGDSPEIKVLVPLVKGFGNTLIGMVGNMQSFLATHSDLVLNTTIEQEVCPNNLAPTTSTTAQMVMGDALAVCLMQLKGFRKDDFARFHPGGALGKKLYLRVSDILSSNKPSVKPDTPLPALIMEITKNRLGATAVLNDQDQVVGIVTDGDLRRMLEKKVNTTDLQTEAIMNQTPRTIDLHALAVEAVEQMRAHNINQLIVNDAKVYCGIIHIQDLVREGIL
ncbi:MAG: SIS domain-containing protein [Ferruginibacter sp.]